MGSLPHIFKVSLMSGGFLECGGMNRLAQSKLFSIPDRHFTCTQNGRKWCGSAQDQKPSLPLLFQDAQPEITLHISYHMFMSFFSWNLLICCNGKLEKMLLGLLSLSCSHSLRCPAHSCHGDRHPDIVRLLLHYELRSPSLSCSFISI